MEELNTTFQKQNESCRTYVQRIVRLVEKYVWEKQYANAFFYSGDNEVTSYLTKHQTAKILILGLNDSTVRRKVLQLTKKQPQLSLGKLIQSVLEISRNI